jgi:hypothetical protein
MYKIYESNNYIIVESVAPKEVFYGHKKNVFIDKSNVNKPTYSIFNVRDLKDDTTVSIGEIQKQDGSLYTEAEFDTFYRTNTGNFNGGGTAPTGDFIPLSGTELDSPVTGNIEFFSPATGSNPLIDISDGISISNGESNSISIQEEITLSANKLPASTVNIDASASSRGLTGTNDHSLNITDLDYPQKIYVDSAINASAVKNSTTLLTLSGVIAINIDNTKFNVPAGTGVIYKNGNITDVSWDTLTAQTTPFIGVAPNTFLAINENGALVKTQDLQDVTEMGDIIPLGFLEHTGSVIERVGTEPQYNVNLGTQWQQFLETFGNFVVDGFDITATNLNLNVSAGTMFDNGLGYTQNIKAPNHYSSIAIAIPNLKYYYRDGAGDWINNSAFVTAVNPSIYDDGSGTPQNIPSGKWTIQRVTYYPPFGYVDIYLDQKYYNSKEEALNGYLTDSFEENPYLSYNLPIATIIAKHATTDLNNTADAVIRKVAKSTFGGNSVGGGETNTASNVGTLGIGVFDTKVGVDLRFKNISENSNKVSIIEDVNKNIKFDVNESNFTGIPQSAVTNLTADLSNKLDKNALITSGTGTKISYDAKGLVTSSSNATTADITSVTNSRYVTDVQLARTNTVATATSDGYVNQALFKSIRKLVSTNTAESQNITNTTAETTFTTGGCQFTVASSEMRVGLQIIIEGNMIQSTGSSGYTLNLRLKGGSAGTTTLHTTGNRTVSPSQINVGCILRTTITILSLGVTGTCSIQMEYLATEGQYTDGVIVASNGVKTINTTANNVFGISGQWSGLSTSNNLKIEKINYYLQN